MACVSVHVIIAQSEAPLISISTTDPSALWWLITVNEVDYTKFCCYTLEGY